MSTPEFSRIVDRRSLAGDPVTLCANAQEREALASRFALIAIDRLEARVDLEAKGETIAASGRLEADIVQTCAVSGDDLKVRIDEPFAVRFVPERSITEEEIELEEEDLDEVPYDGTAFDLGEAVAQSLALAIDPYATGPGADPVREAHGLADKPAGPLADALRALGKT